MRKYLRLAAVFAALSLSFLVGKHYGAALERERNPAVTAPQVHRTDPRVLSAMKATLDRIAAASEETD